jgi:LytS/YehU family sensor histidine kinase
MLNNLWSFVSDPAIISLTLFVLWILAIQKKKRVQYFLEGRLANQHTINNLLVNSISIDNSELQASYLRFVAKFVKYGFNCQDKSSVTLKEELELINDLLRGYEMSNEARFNIEIDIDNEQMNLPVIPFSLITIVENAVHYGELERSTNKLVIGITCISEKLYKINFSGYVMPEKSKIENPLKGHGLYILKQRIKFVHYDKNTNSIKRNRYLFLKDDCLQMILPK